MYRRIALSINRVPIRVRTEQWYWLRVYDDDALETVEQPDYVTTDDDGMLVAYRRLLDDSYLRVTYIELNEEEGYILSASCVRQPERRAILWARRH